MCVCVFRLTTFQLFDRFYWHFTRTSCNWRFLPVSQPSSFPTWLPWNLIFDSNRNFKRPNADSTTLHRSCRIENPLEHNTPKTVYKCHNSRHVIDIELTFPSFENVGRFLDHTVISSAICTGSDHLDYAVSLVSQRIGRAREVAANRMSYITNLILHKSRSHVWCLWQTFVTCGYLSQSGNGAHMQTFINFPFTYWLSINVPASQNLKFEPLLTAWHHWLLPSSVRD